MIELDVPCCDLQETACDAIPAYPDIKTSTFLHFDITFRYSLAIS